MPWSHRGAEGATREVADRMRESYLEVFEVLFRSFEVLFRSFEVLGQIVQLVLFCYSQLFGVLRSFGTKLSLRGKGCKTLEFSVKPGLFEIWIFRSLVNLETF